MTSIAQQVRTKTSAEVRVATFGFAVKLGDSGALLSGTPTITVSPSGPTIGTVTKNASAITVNGIAHAANQAAQATVTGGTAGTLYLLTCTAVTDSGETMEIKGYLRVE